MKNIFKFFLGVFFLLLTVNVNASPANDLFIDDNLYKCVIDAYNSNLNENKDYSYNLTLLELNSITNLDCSNYKGTIEDLTGLDRLNGLTNLNLSGNVFLGGSLNIVGNHDTLRSNIILPNHLSLTDIKYNIENSKIVKIVDDVVYPLSSGSTYVTMTAKVLGNEIKERYLVSVPGSYVKKSSNAKLASLFLSHGEFAFDSDKKSYSVVVSNLIDEVTINANVLDKKATFVSGYGPRKVNLTVGSNILYVKVKAEDGTINTYTISIIRSDGNDLNSRLINLELSVGNIKFDPDIYIYNFSVDSNVDVIDVKAVAESTLAKVEVSDTKLKVGNNKITITVTSESGSKTNYELIITREDYNSIDNYLSNIVVAGYNIEFNKNIFNYYLDITNEDFLNIVATTENNDATYKVLGNSALKQGSKITIQVSDKEGSTREYYINIKSKSSDITFMDDFDYKWIILIIEFILIIILILVIIFRNTNKPKRPKKPKNVRKKVKSNKKNNTSINVAVKKCKACGSMNDVKSKTCYVCGNLLK